MLLSRPLRAKNTTYLANPNLTTIKPDYPGNRMVDGAFVDHRSLPRSLWEVLKWKLSQNPKRKEKSEEHPSMKIITHAALPQNKSDDMMWLGHASFVLRIGGKTLLTDPCLTSPPLVKRHTPLPVAIEEINPDYLLVSHGHYDHLDSNTLEHFRHGQALIPLKMSETIHDINAALTTQEAGWYQEYRIDESFSITFLPAHHWHRRGLNDANTVLWGSFVIRTPQRTIYFAGDTAYGDHFKEIGTLFDIDIAILPIGAYAPRWFMGDSHMNPADTLKAFDDLGARELIPMHYGTFDLSDEPLGEPEALLREIGHKHPIRFVHIGEMVSLG
jgi:L-ascorbate metabolism protein UlaG (beta-lactamase superfamily)